MMERYQYSVVRFVPNVVRDEGVNVGVIIKEAEGAKFVYRFLPRGATVRRLWPDADERLVNNFAHQLRAAQVQDRPLEGIGHPSDRVFFQLARAEFNGNLQLAEPRGMLAESIEEVLSRIYDTYVAEPKSGPRPINYQAIAPYQTRARLWSAFQKKRLLRPGLVRRQYVLKGRHAPWTFDLGYKNGGIKLINSVALNAPTAETNLGRALVFKGMIEDVKAAQETRVKSTAVVLLPQPQGKGPGAREAQEILTDARIEIYNIAELAQLVERVERELL